MAASEATARRGPRGPYAKSQQTRLLILDAALEVFAENGYRSGSLREVAARIDMSEAGLLHHFPNKSALLGAVLEHRDNHTQQMVPLDASRGRDALRNLIKVARYNETTPGVVELFSTLSAEATSVDHPAHDFFQGRYRMIVGMVTESLEHLQTEGELREGVHIESAARQAIAVWDGLQIQWLLDRSSLDLPNELKRYFDSILVSPL